MIGPDDIRRVALALPETYEAPHFDMASFRVGKKIFCTIHTQAPRIMLRLDPEDQHNLSDGEVITPSRATGAATAPPSWTTAGSPPSGCRA